MAAPNTARWLKNVAPQAVMQTQCKTAQVLAAVVKENCAALTAQQLLKVQQKCKEGLGKPNFDFLTYDNLNSMD